MNGKELWSVDIGVLDSGWFFDPTYQWGHSSSPVIHDGKVIVQADIQKNSFIAAYDVRTGKQVWKTERDEIPSWGTPTIFTSHSGAEIVTNGPTVRAYDPETGKELWKLGPNSEVTVGTPVVGDGLVFVTGGYPPVRPIYAVRPTAKRRHLDAEGHRRRARPSPGATPPAPISRRRSTTTASSTPATTAACSPPTTRRPASASTAPASAAAARSPRRRSPPTASSISPTRTATSSSRAPAGRYEELAKNSMKEVIMSTPAISDGLLIVRTLGHVYGIGAAK